MKREIATAMLVLPIGMTTLLPNSALAMERRSAPNTSQTILIADWDNNRRDDDRWDNNRRYDNRWDNNRRYDNRWDNNRQNNGRWDNNRQNNSRYYQQYGNRRVWVPAHWEPGFLGIGRRWVEGHWEYRR